MGHKSRVCAVLFDVDSSSYEEAARFWSGALGRGDVDLDALLTGLTRKGFLARQRRSSVAGEEEWTFAHILLRDVAYAQIARVERSDRHRRTAEWLESLGRPEDHAAVIAYHWRTALELARAAGQSVVELEVPTRVALSSAGERAFAVNSYAEAARHLEAALSLWPHTDEGRPALLFRYAEALYLTDSNDASVALAIARDALLEEGHGELAAGAELMLSRLAWHGGRNDEASEHQSAAESLVGDGQSLMATKVLAYGARTRTISGEQEEGLEMATRALTMADALGADELRAHALCTMGLARGAQGCDDARELIQQALDIAVSLRSPEAGSIANNLAVQAFLDLRLVEARRLFVEGLRIAEYFGDVSGSLFLKSQVAIFDHVTGDWGAFEAVADPSIAEWESGSSNYQESMLRVNRARVRIARDEADGALSDLRSAIDLARGQRDPQELMPALGAAVLVFEETGHEAEAEELAAELIGLADRYPFEATWTLSLDFLFSRTAAGHTEPLRAALSRAPDVPWRAIAFACLDGDFVRAAEMHARAGSPTSEARLRLRAAEDLAAMGQVDESRAQAQRASDFYRRVGAIRYLEIASRLLEGPA
jgi:tetratricopeptide (TPR) repeat protein